MAVRYTHNRKEHVSLVKEDASRRDAAALHPARTYSRKEGGSGSNDIFPFTPSRKLPRTAAMAA